MAARTARAEGADHAVFRLPRLSRFAASRRSTSSRRFARPPREAKALRASPDLPADCAIKVDLRGDRARGRGPAVGGPRAQARPRRRRVAGGTRARSGRWTNGLSRGARRRESRSPACSSRRWPPAAPPAPPRSAARSPSARPSLRVAAGARQLRDARARSSASARPSRCACRRARRCRTPSRCGSPAAGCDGLRQCVNPDEPRRAPAGRCRAGEVRQPARSSLARPGRRGDGLAGPAGAFGAPAVIAGFDRLVDAVQANCHVTDARHARNMTMCTYLLEMRELYRWERGTPHDGARSRAREVGALDRDREALWARSRRPTTGRCRSRAATSIPFDVEDGQSRAAAAGPGLRCGHRALRQAAVLPRRARARRVARRRAHPRRGPRVRPRSRAGAGRAARRAPSTCGRTALRRVLWERAEAWSVKRPDGALRAALDAYGFADDAEDALERMAAPKRRR